MVLTQLKEKVRSQQQGKEGTAVFAVGEQLLEIVGENRGAAESKAIVPE